VVIGWTAAQFLWKVEDSKESTEDLDDKAAGQFLDAFELEGVR